MIINMIINMSNCILNEENPFYLNVENHYYLIEENHYFSYKYLMGYNYY